MTYIYVIKIVFRDSFDLILTKRESKEHEMARSKIKPEKNKIKEIYDKSFEKGIDKYHLMLW